MAWRRSYIFRVCHIRKFITLLPTVTEWAFREKCRSSFFIHRKTTKCHFRSFDYSFRRETKSLVTFDMLDRKMLKYRLENYSEHSLQRWNELWKFLVGARVVSWPILILSPATRATGLKFFSPVYLIFDYIW